jgi:hypothetical protein
MKNKRDRHIYIERYTKEKGGEQREREIFIPSNISSERQRA